MGAWGTGIFENDGALDFVGDIADNGSWKPYAKQIKVVAKKAKRGKLIEASEGDWVLAGCALIAHGRGAPIQNWVSEPAPDQLASCPLKLESLLKIALPVVLDGANSELRELWEETDDFQAWLDAGNRVRSVLA